jgi:hypothetical protein
VALLNFRQEVFKAGLDLDARQKLVEKFDIGPVYGASRTAARQFEAAGRRLLMEIIGRFGAAFGNSRTNRVLRDRDAVAASHLLYE